MFAIQDEIAETVALAVEPAISKAEQDRISRKPPDSLDAWEAYQRGLWHAGKETLEDNARARVFFEQATRLDPAFAPAQAELAWSCLTEASTYASRPYRAAMELTIQLGRAALQLDPFEAEAHTAIGAAHINLGDFTLAAFHFERALAVNPNNARAWRGKAAPLLYSGHPAEARSVLFNALRLNPRGDTAARIRAQIAHSYYYERDYAKAVDAAKQGIAEHPSHPWCYRWLTASLGQLGRTEEASAALRSALGISPQSIQFFVRERRPYERSEDHAHMVEGLRKAGWQG